MCIRDSFITMSGIALCVQNKRWMRLVTDAKRRSQYIPSTNSYCKMRGSIKGDEFVYPAKKRVYHRWISKHTRAMVADKKATRNLCQTRFTATKRKKNAQQCCASIVQQDEKKFKKLSIIGTVWNVPAQEKKRTAATYQRMKDVTSTQVATWDRSNGQEKTKELLRMTYVLWTS